MRQWLTILDRHRAELAPPPLPGEDRYDDYIDGYYDRYNDYFFPSDDVDPEEAQTLTHNIESSRTWLI